MKFFAFGCLLAVFLAVGCESQSYPKPPAPPAYPPPASPSYPKPQAEDPPQPYKFEYTVKDEPTKNDYGHQQESEDGKSATGFYKILLPDGRTQIVSYRADVNGYNADVKYEPGKNQQPQYPQYPPPQQPYPEPPKPSYPPSKPPAPYSG